MKNSREWAVIYQGAVHEVNEDGDEISRWVNGIQQAEMTLKEAHELSEQLSDGDADFQFWVVHESSNSYKQHL